MNNHGKNATLWIVIGLALVALFNLFHGGQGSRNSQRSAVYYSEFVTEAERGHVIEVEIRGNHIGFRMNDGRYLTTYAPDGHNLIDKLQQLNVKIRAFPADEDSPGFLHILFSWLPTLLLLGVWIFFFRQMQAGGNKAMSFGKSRARMHSEARPKVTFADVAGVDEAKADLQEIVEFLKDPPKFQRLGGKIPKGVLLIGPPGTGKTLLAKAVAGEASVPFFSISGSEFVEMFVGVGASRVRDLFDQAKPKAPCIIFVDELDSVGRQRGANHSGGSNDEREQTLNQLLVEMDGFEGTEGIIVIAATNRPDILDHALLRPGRFDRQVVVSNPDVDGREKILKVHTREMPLASDVDLRIIARGTPGFSGADLRNLVNEAALLAARMGKLKISMEHLEAAKDKVLMGPERRSMVMSERDKKITAYHEAGHALVTINMPSADPIHKATIIPRGRALGLVMQLPEDDNISHDKEQLCTRLAILMGGRSAEEIILGHGKITGGASNDIKVATNIARSMVTEFGMSERLGPVAYGDSHSEGIFPTGRQISPTTAQQIDEEIRKLLDQAHSQAKDILQTKIEDLHKLAGALLEYETLNGEEIKQVIAGNFVREIIDEPATEPRRSTIPAGGKA